MRWRECARRLIGNAQLIKSNRAEHIHCLCVCVSLHMCWCMCVFAFVVLRVENYVVDVVPGGKWGIAIMPWGCFAAHVGCGYNRETHSCLLTLILH